MIKRGGAGLKFDNDFFNTEVREGFEISSMMKRAWAAQMEVFQVVSDICNRNGIRYFADFGTLLGAVRHKGMIPWDDDIDISLMRDEYNELIRILPGELPYGFVVAGMYADCERLQNAAFYVSSMALWIDNDSYKMRKECFDDVIEMPFENFVVKAPKNYDEVLKAEFGDYMIPVKGTADHTYPFYGHMEQELIKQIRRVGFKGSVDEFCEEVASGRLRV